MPGRLTFAPTVLQTACKVHRPICNRMRGPFPLTAVYYSLMINGTVPVRSKETCRPNRCMASVIRDVWLQSFVIWALDGGE